jgi:hypothetical protein
MIMNWKRRMSRHLLFALLGGTAATAIYWGLLYTKALPGLAVKALSPAIDLAYSLDPIHHARSHRYLEQLAANVVLYAFWIFVALIGIDLLRQLKRKLAQ